MGGSDDGDGDKKGGADVGFPAPGVLAARTVVARTGEFPERGGIMTPICSISWHRITR